MKNLPRDRYAASCTLGLACSPSGQARQLVFKFRAASEQPWSCPRCLFVAKGSQHGSQAWRTDRRNSTGGPAGRARAHGANRAYRQHGPRRPGLRDHLAGVLRTMIVAGAASGIAKSPGLVCMLVAVVISGSSLGQVHADDLQRAADSIQQGAPPSEQGKPAESKPGGTRPTTPAPEPAHPDPEAEKQGAKAPLPPAPAEKIAPPIKEK